MSNFEIEVIAQMSKKLLAVSSDIQKETSDYLIQTMSPFQALC